MSPKQSPSFNYYEQVLITGLYDHGDNREYELKAYFVRFANSGKTVVVMIGGIQYTFTSDKVKKLNVYP